MRAIRRRRAIPDTYHALGSREGAPARNCFASRRKPPDRGDDDAIWRALTDIRHIAARESFDDCLRARGGSARLLTTVMHMTRRYARRGAARRYDESRHDWPHGHCLLAT